MSADSPFAHHEVANVTLMQIRAVEASVRGEVVPGASACAQYHRLRRLSIKLGKHRPRGDAGRKTRQFRLNTSDRRGAMAGPTNEPHEQAA